MLPQWHKGPTKIHLELGLGTSPFGNLFRETTDAETDAATATDLSVTDVPQKSSLVERQLERGAPSFNPTTAATFTIELPELPRATIVSVAPVLILVLFSQRFLGCRNDRGWHEGVTPPSA